MRDSYIYKDLGKQLTFLKCKAWGEANIPYFTGTLGCPPEYCSNCRTKFDKRQDYYTKITKDKWRKRE